jgi:hypothetical protein
VSSSGPVKVTRVKWGLRDRMPATVTRNGRYPGRESGTTGAGATEVSIT